MKRKCSFAKTYYGILVITILLFGCNGKTETVITLPNQDFNGLYKVEFEGNDLQYIWIFTDDLRYVLYPGTNSKYINSNNSINYETPTHYFIKENKFYACGIDNAVSLTSLSDCKNNIKEPRYIIVSIDTIENSYFRNKHQVIELEDFYTKHSVKLKRSI